MARADKSVDPSEFLGGVLHILGLKIDLGDLLASSDKLRTRLEQLQERLSAEGNEGKANITGYIRTRGLLGNSEFHLGTLGKPPGRAERKAARPPSEATEPPVDVFDEPDHIVVVADVPGLTLQDLELGLQGDTLSIASKQGTPRSYRKDIRLAAPVDPSDMQATCRNGVLQVRLPKLPAESTPERNT
ncbi:MAG: Hsp20/alpha crystallin family protein [Chloroflexi bacterium]|nr:Hsp20/alpha crystallin family protein [Chloroflexota bacterium]